MSNAPISRKKVTFKIIFTIIAIVVLISSNKLVETVEKGTYDIIQRPLTGTMEAKMKTGMYFQGWSDVYTWPRSETFFFTSDADEGKKHDQSIEVRFNDGSVAKISGTCRVLLPTNKTQSIHLMTNMNFKDYNDLEARLILPLVRNSLRLTANLMTARESYSEKRSDFITWSWDQIQNGTYQTEEKEEKSEYITDPLTKEKVLKRSKIIKTDKSGNKLREKNPLKETGIQLTNFEIKQFVYEEKVREQISEQQENMMAITTARVKAERAKQNEKTKEAQGKANVMEVKYEQLKIKEKAIVDAQKEKEVAEIQASKELEVAKLAKLAAEQTKEKEILLGEGEAKRKKLVMEADGALKQKLETLEAIQTKWAEAYATRKVPSVYMNGANGDTGAASPDDEFKRFMNMMNIQAAKQLSLDTAIKGSDK